MLSKAKQRRATQGGSPKHLSLSGAKLSNARHSKDKQSKAMKSKAKLRKAKQGKTKQAKQGKVKQCKAVTSKANQSDSKQTNATFASLPFSLHVLVSFHSSAVSTWPCCSSHACTFAVCMHQTRRCACFCLA